MRVIEQLNQSIRSAATYNSDAQAAPFCILWPDKDRQWESVIGKLQGLMPELYVLGEYNPTQRTGPAIWLRCMVAEKITDLPGTGGRKPVLYLPGVSRQDLRAVEQCPDALKPLAELQYRSALWSQVNARDWTALAYFVTAKTGLGLDVAQDRESVLSLQAALSKLLDEDVDTLKGKHIDKEYCTELLAGADPVKEILRWMQQPGDYKNSRSPEEWRAFVDTCKAKYKFDPDNDGVLSAADHLAARQGSWIHVWDRFREAPAKYPAVPGLIRQTVMPLWADPSGWPQWNESEEKQLRSALKTLDALTPAQSRQQLLQLESSHGQRRESVWADLDEAPLAKALEWLALAAKVTTNAVAGTPEEMARYYAAECWIADDAVLRALSAVTKPEDVAAVSTAVRAIYLPWLSETAHHLQNQVRQGTYPGGNIEKAATVSYPAGECVVFVDGLRLDLAVRLSELIQHSGLTVENRPYWTGLPTVTPTGKPIVMPIRGKLFGDAGNIEFEPSIISTGKTATFDRLQKQLEELGWSVEDAAMALGEHAWVEAASIDKAGHDSGYKLARQVDGILADICQTVVSLLDGGWKQIRIVSDHGWLLMPGGLPKIDLPSSLSDNKWGRCAMIKPGAKCAESQYPWYWNPNVQVALPAGISCYRSGMEYSHGGLSLQECVLLELKVSKQGGAAAKTTAIITGAVWKGLRCKVSVEAAAPGLTVDLRLKPGNAATSIALGQKVLDENGQASIVVEEEDHAGKAAALVLLDAAGQLVAQMPTIVGGE